MASARWFLIGTGIVFAFAGVYVASAVDRFVGLALLIVGAFLMVLPFTRGAGEE